MAPLWLMTLYRDYEIKRNTIILKEKGNIVYEFPIPKDYYLIGMIERTTDLLFMFSEYQLECPKQIPRGYTNLTLSDIGLYKAESEEQSLYMDKAKIQSKRELFYMDTSHLTASDLLLACNNCCPISEKDIPKNFWFSIQSRELLNEYLNHSSGWIDRTRYENMIPYLVAFDSRARIINEYELIAIEAYNRHGKDFPFLLDDSLYEKYMWTSKVKFGGALINTENFFKIASSMDNPNVYLCITAEKIDDHFCKYRSHPIYAKDTELYPWFMIPVIEKQENNVKLLKK